MKIAASTSTTRELPIPEAMELVARTGYEGLEIWVEHIWKQRQAPVALRRLASELRLLLTMHGPQRDLNVTSSNAGIRAESQRQYLAALEDAAELGAELIVLHPGALSSSGDDPTAFWPILREFFAVVAERGDELGVRVGVENMERRRLEFVTSPEAVLSLISAIGSGRLGITLDLAHCLYDGQEVGLDGLASHVCHVHISGSTRDKVHVPLDEGIYGMREAVERLVPLYGGVVAIEGFVRGQAPHVLRRNYDLARLWLEGSSLPAAGSATV